MLHELLGGDLGAAAGYNAVALAALPLLAYLFASWAAGIYLRTKPRWLRWAPGSKATLIILAVTVVWGVARNIPVAPFTSLYV